MKVTFRGGLFLFVLMGPAVVLYVTMMLFTTVPLIALKYTFGERRMSKLYRYFNSFHDLFLRFFMGWVSQQLELCLGTRVAYTFVDEAGEAHLSPYLTRDGHPDLTKLLRPASPGKFKIIIMNHHTRVDWLYFFLFGAYSSIADSSRVVLKRSIGELPIMGWAMQSFRFLFISRNWAQDEDYLNQMVQYFKDTGDAATIFIFPEGTDLSPSNIEKSQAYARKSGLPEFNHVLNPRTTGLVGLKNMLGAENIEEIIDLTIGYTYSAPGARPDELSLINGRNARKVHLLVKVYAFEGSTASLSTSVAPSGDDALAQWIHDRFAEKEELLSRFARSNPVGFDFADVAAVFGKQHAVAAYDEDLTIAQHPEKLKLRRYYDNFGMYGVVFLPMFWWSLVIFLSYMLGTFDYLGLLALATVALTLFTRRVGSIQQLLMLNKAASGQALTAKLTRRLKGGEAKTKGRR